MQNHNLTEKEIQIFERHLKKEEYAPGTVEKYLRDVNHLRNWLGERPVTKHGVVKWREHLLEHGYAPVTINSMLVAVNCFFKAVGWDDCRVKELRIQRRLFRSTEKELTKEEYLRLVETAQSLGRERLALLMQTVCATGIRVSEVKYITVEALQVGRAEIHLKGKIRTILIPNKLCRRLLKYAKKQKTVSGEVFLTRNGKGLSRRQIWAEMKSVCKKARVQPSKVFPHNLRHVFARTFYKAYKDVARLADILGHSSIETTRIYLLSSGMEHARQMERLGLFFTPEIDKIIQSP